MISEGDKALPIQLCLSTGAEFIGGDRRFFCEAGPGRRCVTTRWISGRRVGRRGLQDSIWTNTLFLWRLDRGLCTSMSGREIRSSKSEIRRSRRMETAVGWASWRFSIHIEAGSTLAMRKQWDALSRSERRLWRARWRTRGASFSRGISRFRCPIFRAGPCDHHNPNSADPGGRKSCKLAHAGWPFCRSFPVESASHEGRQARGLVSSGRGSLARYECAVPLTLVEKGAPSNLQYETHLKSTNSFFLWQLNGGSCRSSL